MPDPLWTTCKTCSLILEAAAYLTYWNWWKDNLNVLVLVCVSVYTPGANPVDSAPHPQSSLPAFDVNSLKLDLCGTRP